jgi:hypothetical protein
LTPTGLQRALDFLGDLPDLAARSRLAPLPPRVDYASLTGLGLSCGYAFTEAEIAEAFRIFCRARTLSRMSAAGAGVPAP